MGGRKRKKKAEGKEEVQRRLEDQCDRNWLWVENPALQFSMQLHFNNAYGGHHEERSQAPSRYIMLTAGSPRKTEITSSVPGLTDYMKGERAENPQMNYYRKKKN